MIREILLAILFVILGFYLGSVFNSQIVIITEDAPLLPLMTVSLIGNVSDASFSQITIPAVDNNENGLITSLFVQAMPGSGSTLANIDNILFFTDTQNSIRTARLVAQNVTGKNLSQFDLVYTIIANASVITGPSAGGSIAVATIAALEGKKINSSVMMTGNINRQGKIGPVGQIKAKAKAAEDIGAQLFLVPASQASEIQYTTERVCEIIGTTEFCSVKTIEETINISEGSGIRIVGVEDIWDVLSYFLVDEEEE